MTYGFVFGYAYQALRCNVTSDHVEAQCVTVPGVGHSMKFQLRVEHADINTLKDAYVYANTCTPARVYTGGGAGRPAFLGERVVHGA